jgi:hypothetical protein
VRAVLVLAGLADGQQQVPRFPLENLAPARDRQVLGDEPQIHPQTKSRLFLIEGVTPLLCNRFTDAAQQAATNGTRMSAVGDKGTPRGSGGTAALSRLGRQAVHPQPNLFRCIIDAGTFFKAGKSKVTTQKTSLIPACVEVVGIEIPIEHKDPWEVDARAVRIPSTGGRILYYRPSFNDWRLSFTLSIDNDLISTKLVREIIDAAGKRIGLGDFRPANKGPFGKFVVVSWQEHEDLGAGERHIPRLHRGVFLQ